MQFFRLSTARMKINQIPNVIFQVTSQFFFKFASLFSAMTHNSPEFFHLKYYNALDIKEPIDVQFFRLLSTLMKVQPMSFLKPQVRIYSNFASLFSVMGDNSSVPF